ncbi:hypothetical protein [Streptomyces sp. NPDC005408]|uniref:hypothetical protein n=1 Tax=Streptomyces sp. NPDC005408 TaxID=3155341 RepID=UPI0033BD17D0
MDTTTDRTTLRLRLRRRVEWVPVAALVLLVAWGISVAAIVDGPNGIAGGIALSVVGVPVAVIALSCAGHLVRPLGVTVDADGLTVRLPTWPVRTVPWSEMRGVSASSPYILLDCDAPVGKLPRTCRLRAAYRRLAPELERPGGDGLCFETQVFDVEAAELLDAIRQYAPTGLTITDDAGR